MHRKEWFTPMTIAGRRKCRRVPERDDCFAYKMPMKSGENWYATGMIALRRKCQNAAGTGPLTNSGVTGTSGRALRMLEPLTSVEEYRNEWSCAEDSGTVNKC